MPVLDNRFHKDIAKIKLADGLKLTHYYFMPDEYLVLKDGKLFVFIENNLHETSWDNYQRTSYQYGWSEYQSVLSY